jgi:predicted CopG family antitoxin
MPMNIALQYTRVTKQVALAESTYLRLRGNRRPGESFSAAIDRLLDNQPKDPMRFVEEARKHKNIMSHEEALAMIEAERDADLL